jgi:hypothetical protein
LVAVPAPANNSVKQQFVPFSCIYLPAFMKASIDLVVLLSVFNLCRFTFEIGIIGNISAGTDTGTGT